jgi:ABC-type sugar transport system ATPase subunit
MLVEIEDVHRSYPGVRALSGVDLAIRSGEVHALLGENGAGKSTLMKVIAGSVLPDRGRVTLDGEPLPLGAPEAVRGRGVAIVYQELSLVPTLTVGENVVLGRWPGRGGRIDWEAVYREAERHLRRIGFEVDPRVRVDRLGMAERQLVEFAKALSTDPRILLLDEPTSALSEREGQRLFQIIRDLTGSGVGVLYVSHRLGEVLTIADRITVLRDGEKIATVEAAGVDEAELARMMVGRTVEASTGVTGEGRAPEDALALRTRGLARPPRLRPIDLELRHGEVVGVFGLVGAGRTRLAQALFGLEPATTGSIEVDGTPVRIASPVDAIAAGIGYLGEDRSIGIVPKMTVASNITLASWDRIARGPLLNFSEERKLAQEYVQDLRIRTPTVERPAGTISGGNQQKVVLARWLCSRSRILILDDPTRGIDVGAKEEVFRLVRRLASEGVAVLYITSEIREARDLADRILVMSGGRIVREVDPETSEEEIMRAAGGVVQVHG